MNARCANIFCPNNARSNWTHCRACTDAVDEERKRRGWPPLWEPSGMSSQIGDRDLPDEDKIL